MSLRVNAMPRPEDTTARLHQPDTHYDGSPRHICVVEFEQMSVQFDSPEDALAWLAWCADHVREALRAQGGVPEPTNEDSLLAEVLDDFNQYAVLAEAIRERDAARAEVLRLRALLDDVLACAHPGTYGERVVYLDSPTWDALQDLGGES